jgi:hypothetical protein
MIFGQPSEFAVEVYHEPHSSSWGGFGRMCIHVQGVQLGDICENHCSLFHATDQFRKLYLCVETLWDESFVGLTDTEIFAVVDHALYLGEESEYERFGRFDFLTNTGEQFDDAKTFIVCRPHGQVHILYQLLDNTFGSGSCSADSFRSVIGAYVPWFETQVRNTAAPVSPVNPIDTSEIVSG